MKFASIQFFFRNLLKESYEAITVDFNGILGGSRTHRTRILSAVHMPILLRGHRMVARMGFEPTLQRFSYYSILLWPQ